MRFFLFLTLIILNLALFAASVEATPIDSLESNQSALAISQDSVICISGGPGASSCQVLPGMQIGEGVTVGCSVNCISGYFACCGIKCECKIDTSN